MKKKSNKIVVVGAGMVGASFLFAAMAQGLANEYGIIDVNNDLAEGNKLDFEDFVPATPNSCTVKHGGYELVEDADLIVITAGRAQRPNETRLEMSEGNAMIMKSIATAIKNTNFNGITVVASNPVDVMTAVYQKVTGYNPKKVISSSCSLDTNRLKVKVGELLNVCPKSLNMFVLGEHGDSSVATLKYASFNGVPLKNVDKSIKWDEKLTDEINEYVRRKAYEIINRKGATYYGVGGALFEIARSILWNENKIFAVGSLLNGEYGQNGVYAGVPTIVGRDGIVKTVEFPLSEDELTLFKKSVSVIKEYTESVLKKI